MWTPGGPKGAGQKRKRGQKRKSRDAELFPYFHTINRQELQQYHDIVFVNPNLRDTLYFMHINSSRNNRQILRYTSMSRRRHLGTNIACDWRERFIKHRNNVDEIRAAEQRLTQTNTHSTSTNGFRSICFHTGRSRQRPRSSLRKPNLSKNKMEDLDRETKRLFPLG